jgi:hypothetical protein
MEDTNMKKTYINPELEVIKIATQQMLAGSTLTIDDSIEITNETNLLSPSFDDETFDFGTDGVTDFDNF